MKKITTVLMSTALLFALSASAFAGDCCTGGACCKGQACCKSHKK